MGQGQRWAALGAGMLPSSHLGEEAAALGFLVPIQGDFLPLPCQGISCGPRMKLGSPRWIRVRAGLGGVREGMAQCSRRG